MTSNTTLAGALIVTVAPDVKRPLPTGCEGVAAGSAQPVADISQWDFIRDRQLQLENNEYQMLGKKKEKTIHVSVASFVRMTLKLFYQSSRVSYVTR